MVTKETSCSIGEREFMIDRIEKHGLQVATVLAEFIDKSALPGTGVESNAFWAGFSTLIHYAHQWLTYLFRAQLRFLG